MRASRFTSRWRPETWALILGLLLPQLVVLGPSLIGQKVLLPLEWLNSDQAWTAPTQGGPETPDVVRPPTRWTSSSDTILISEAVRRFQVEEMRQGRVPIWNSHIYGGAPHVGSVIFTLPTPFQLIGAHWLSPVAIAWSQLFKSLVAGLGMYLFLRYALRLSRMAAVVGAWVYPWVGFLIAWIGLAYLSGGLACLPLLMLATHAAVTRRGRLAPVALTLATTLIFTFAHVQIVGHCLFASLVYASFHVVKMWRSAAGRERVAGAVGRCVAGWILGAALFAPVFLSQVNYLLDSARWKNRVAGVAERAPLGIDSALQVILPWIRGDNRPGSMILNHMVRLESAAAAYAGLLLTLVFVPFAWRIVSRRAMATCWLLVALLGLGQILNLPVLAQIDSLPPLGWLSANRMTCLTCFSLVLLGAMGVDAITRRRLSRPAWWAWPMVLPIGLMAWLLYELSTLDTRVIREIFLANRGASEDGAIALHEAVIPWFHTQYAVGLLLALAALVFQLLLARPETTRPFRVRVAWVVAVACLTESVLTAFPAIPQNDASFYPHEPAAIRQAKSLPPGRFLSLDTFPLNLNLWWGLDAITGYDSADPLNMTTLLLSASKDPSLKPGYCQFLAFSPREERGVLRALNVRYLVKRSLEPGDPAPLIAARDFVVIENPGALPRAFVPRSVRSVATRDEELRVMNARDFDAGVCSLIGGETPLQVDHAEGEAHVLEDKSTLLKVGYEMKTPGVVVLADNFLPGWSAACNGQPVPILRANYATRAVEVPAGRGVIEFRYMPPGFRLGFALASIAAVILFGLWWIDRRRLASR